LKWIKPWFATNVRAVPLEISASLAAVGLVFQIRRRDRIRVWKILAGLAASLAFWFFTAPDVRFATGLLFAFGATVFASAIPMPEVPAWGRVLAIGILIGAVQASLLQLPAQWPQVPRARTEVKSIRGLQVRFPIDGPQCWAEAPPCTPYEFDLPTWEADEIRRILAKE
jgi:hypothetical protein